MAKQIIRAATVNLAPVRPGDLITAAFFNSLVTALQTLERRLAVIERLAERAQDLDDPEQTVLEIESARLAQGVCTVTGRGLDPAGIARVSVNGLNISVTSLRGSDEEIVFPINPKVLSAATQEEGEVMEIMQERRAASNFSTNLQDVKAPRQGALILRIENEDGASDTAELVVD